MLLSEMSKEELLKFKDDVQKEYDDFKNQGLSLNMARGKPSSAQLDLAMKMLAAVNSYTLIIKLPTERIAVTTADLTEL